MTRFVQIGGERLQLDDTEGQQDNRWPVVVRANGFKDNGNSTKVPLGANEKFTGVALHSIEYSAIVISCSADAPSATNGVSFQASSDGVNWKETDPYTYTNGGTCKTWTVQTIGEYFRIEYTNGATPQTQFDLCVVAKKSAGVTSSHRVADNISGQDDAALTKTILMAEQAGGTPDVYTNIQATAAGNLKTAAEESEPDFWKSYDLEVAAGNITGTLPLNKFGKNPDVDTGPAEDIWGGGGTWVPPTQARIHNIVSADANDTLAGTGAQVVSILGLNASYVETSESINLNGVTPVPTVNSYIIIYRMIVTAAGTGGYNVGTITATAETDATVTAQIETGYNQTLMAIWQVPASKTLYLYDYYASLNGAVAATSVDIRLWVKPFGETWQIKHVLGLSSTGHSYAVHKFDPPLKITEKSLVRLQAADASASNLDIAAGFEGVYR